jgi:hypothetical protein
MHPPQPSRPFTLRSPLGAALALVLALAACSSVELGPWRAPQPVPVASPPPPVVDARVPPPLGVPPPTRPGAQPAPTPAQPVPVPPSSLQAPVPLGPGAAASAPYGPAVAARFPDPAVEFRTPAFAPGHAGYTSNAELHDALVDLVQRTQARGGTTEVRLLDLGLSQQGTPLEALLFSRSEPGTTGVSRGIAQALAPGRPTVVLIGQQHGDEPAPAEALLVIAQELAQGRLEPLLEKINVVVYPRANPDGAEAGRRTTANGIDANRDHLLLKTPEARAQANLVREFAPVVVIDAHEYLVVGRYLEKFNAVQRFDALMQYATTANVSQFVTRAAEEWFRQPAVDALKAEGLTSEWYYTTTPDVADRKISMGGTQPDTGRNVNGLTNAVSILIETRGIGLGRLHLKRRVETHVVAISNMLQSAALRAADLVKLRQYVDQEVARQACQGEAVIEAGPTPSEYKLVMLDPVTGADKPVTVAWDSALELRPVKVRTRPCGYWLSDRESDAVQRLRALGVQVLRLDESGELRGEVYRETARDVVPRQDVLGPSGSVVRVRVQTVPALLDVKAGSYYVPLEQPLGNLVLAALEPDTQNSYLANRIVESLDDQARVMARPTVKVTPVP